MFNISRTIQLLQKSYLPKFLLYFFIIIASTVSANSQKSVRLSLQAPNPICLGDVFYIRVTIDNINDRPTAPTSVSGCKVQYFTLTGSSSKTTIIGSKSTVVSSDIYTLTLKATSPGSYSYGPISVGGVTSNKISYTISSKASANNNSNSSQVSQSSVSQPSLVKKGGRNIFLVASASNTNPYEQEGVVYTVKLYTTYSQLFDWISTKKPSFENSTFEQSKFTDHALKVENFNGKSYNTAVVDRYIVFPTHSGKATITGNNFTASVAANDLYDDPYYSFMSHMVMDQVAVKANNVELNVRQLPENPYHGQLNGVGDFKVTTTLQKKNYKAMQPFELTYEISGIGNLSFVSLPDLSSILPEELKFIKSEDKIDKKVTANNVEGKVTFKCTIIPQTEGELDLPPISFIFFDPVKAKYYKVDTNPIAIKVEPGLKTNVGETNDILKFDRSLETINCFYSNFDFLPNKLWYWSIYFLVAFVLVLTIFLYNRRKNQMQDIAGLKNRKAGKVAQKRLKKAKAYMIKNNRARFYVEMLNSLWGYLSDKLSIPTSELNRDNIYLKLQAHSVPDFLIASLIAIIDDCERANYYSHEDLDMNIIYSKGCELIDELEKEFAR